MNGHGFLARGGIWVTAQLLIMAAGAALGPLCASAHRTHAASRAGGALMALGAVFAVAGIVALGRHTSSFPRPSENTRLVRHGIYRRVRHPMYASLMMVALGWALLWMSWPALLAAIALIVLLDLKSRREERWMTGRFAEYAEYRRTSKRYVPGVF